MWKQKLTAGVVITVAAGVLGMAQSQGIPLVRVVPDEVTLVAMPNGTSQANVVGDITKAGPYAVRTKIPAGRRLAPHFHPEERIVLVMSGTLYVGYGDEFDDTQMKALPPGSVFTEPSRQSHFTWAKDGDVVLHVTGLGPTSTTWIQTRH
jgi:quercetin dioxygenase-like cupin family protein